MKLNDQMFCILPPSEWHEKIIIEFPDAWHAVAGQLKSSDISMITWAQDWFVLASYMASKPRDKFDHIHPDKIPNSLSVKCGLHMDWRKIIPSGEDRITCRHCNCCATISYRKNQK